MGIFAIIIAVAAFALGVYYLICAVNDPTAPYGAGKKIKKSASRARIVDIVIVVIMFCIAILTLLVALGVIG